MTVLLDFDAENLKISQMGPEKLRANFLIKTPENSLKCYQYFDKTKNVLSNAKTLIYLNKKEEEFVKYGDIEAEKFYAKQAEDKKRREEEQSQ